MAPNLTSGIFKIVSLSSEDSPPASVDLIRPAFQRVYLNGPVTTWRINEGENTYQLSPGRYPFTGELGDKVIATIDAGQNLEWRATWQARQDAYTISPANDELKGWTVASDSPNAEIEIRPIIAAPSHPPLFLRTQLFRFVPLDD